MGYRKKIFRKRLPKPVLLSELVDKRARKWRFQALGRLEVIRSKWPEAAGEFVAEHVYPVRLVRKQLRLAADDASWQSEMTYLAPDILERLCALLPGRWIDELKVVQGEPIPEPEAPEEEIRLAEETAEMRHQAENVAHKVDDPELAQRIRRAVVAWRRRLDANPELAVNKKQAEPTMEDGDPR